MTADQVVQQKIHALNQTMGILLHQGNNPQALVTSQEALRLAQEELGEEHSITAVCLNNLGTALRAMGDLAGARQCLERALAIRRQTLGEEHPETALYFKNLGGVLLEIGDLVGARPYLERALAIRRQTLGEEHPDTASSVDTFGVLLSAMGNRAEARIWYERALAIRRKTLGEEHFDTARTLRNLGSLLRAMGDLAGARPYLERALAIRRQTLGEEHPDTVESLNSLGCLLWSLGDLARARTCHERALAIRLQTLGEEHPDTAASLNDLGVVLLDMRNLVEARTNQERALAIRRKTLGEEHPHTAASLNNLGYLLQVMGNLADARTYMEAALAIRLQTLGEEHPDTADSLKNVAVLRVALGEEPEAFKLMQQAGAIDDRILGQVFTVCSDRQRLEFLQALQASLAVFLSLVSRFWQTSEAVRPALDQVLRRKAVAAEALAAQRDAVFGGRYPTLKSAFQQLATVRMQIARQTLAGHGREGLRAHQQRLIEWETRKEELEGELARQVPEMNLEQQARKADSRAVVLALSEGESLVEFVRFSVFDFKAVAQQVEQTLWLPSRYLAFVVQARHPDSVRMIDLGEAEPIERLIAAFRARISVPPEQRRGRAIVKDRVEPAPASGDDPGVALRAAAFDPLVAALGTCRRLLVAPDGDLCRVPFEVLPGADGRMLVDEGYQISYVNTGRDILRFGTRASRPPSLPLVLADPNFDLGGRGFWARLFGRGVTVPPDVSTSADRASRDLPREGMTFSRLGGARKEGKQVGLLLGVVPWLDGEALEGRLKRECRSPRILHLATHGFFLEDQKHEPEGRAGLLSAFGLGGGADRLSGPLPENPLLRSGLALAGANTWLRRGTPPPEAEDGLLTAEDVSGLDLTDTELAVLSACDTGLGEVRTGEGVFGLQRAFILAGVKTLVMSLWQVPDEATRELMTAFYTRLLAGAGRADALREAQQAVRKKYPDPHYWGAFVCLGDPAPLREAATT
jgi:tetratricopeptide (TPR) repeat protein